MSIRERLQYWRNIKGLSVYRLSQLAMVSEQYIHRIEKEGLADAPNVSVEIIGKLCDAMGITKAEFFQDGEETYHPTEKEKQYLHNFQRLLPQEQLAVNAVIEVICTNRTNNEK